MVRRMAFLALAATATLLAGGMTSTARADIAASIWYSTDGSTYTQLGSTGTNPLLATAGGTGLNLSVGGITISTLTLTAAQTPFENFTLGTQTSINANLTSSETLYLLFAATGYSEPTAPPAPALFMYSNATASLVQNASGTFQSFQDTGNVGVNSSGFADALTANSPGPQTTNGGAQTMLITNSGDPYSVVQKLVITFGAGLSAYDGSTTTTLTTPEPTTMASAVVGLGLFAGLGALRRRSRRA